MLPTYLVGTEDYTLSNLRKDLSDYCPQIRIEGISDFFGKADLPKSPSSILFLLLRENTSFEDPVISEFLAEVTSPLICIGNRKDYAYKAIKLDAIDFLLQPYDPCDLIKAVHRAETRINEMQQLEKSKDFAADNPVIGIPTIEGCEFLYIKDVIKCEGLQSYTRIITRNRSDIICSNNIGELKKKLEPFGFFVPHKSYLINPEEMAKYSKEGIIIMKDGSQVPLARRRKHALFEHILHL